MRTLYCWKLKFDKIFNRLKWFFRMFFNRKHRKTRKTTTIAEKVSQFLYYDMGIVTKGLIFWTIICEQRWMSCNVQSEKEPVSLSYLQKKKKSSCDDGSANYSAGSFWEPKWVVTFQTHYIFKHFHSVEGLSLKGFYVVCIGVLKSKETFFQKG